MSNKDHNISAAEASAALKAVQQFKQENNKIIRPPLWLSVLLGVWYGVLTFSHAKMAHENMWALGFIVAVIGFLLTVGFYLYSSRLLGVKPRLMPRTKAQFKFDVLLGVLFIAVMILSRYFTSHGFEMAAYLGAVFNGAVLTYALHNYSVEHIPRG